MYGPPDDVPGECNARLVIGDDYGDNSCTFRCTLPEGHDGEHQEESRSDKPPPGARKAVMRWEGDDRITDVWGEWCSCLWLLAEGQDSEWGPPVMPPDWAAKWKDFQVALGRWKQGNTEPWKCHECGQMMVREERLDQGKCLYRQPGWYCPCGEAVFGVIDAMIFEYMRK